MNACTSRVSARDAQSQYAAACAVHILSITLCSLNWLACLQEVLQELNYDEEVNNIRYSTDQVAWALPFVSAETFCRYIGKVQHRETLSYTNICQFSFSIKSLVHQQPESNTIHYKGGIFASSAHTAAAACMCVLPCSMRKLMRHTLTELIHLSISAKPVRASRQQQCGYLSAQFCEQKISSWLHTAVLSHAVFQHAWGL